MAIPCQSKLALMKGFGGQGNDERWLGFDASVPFSYDVACVHFSRVARRWQWVSSWMSIDGMEWLHTRIESEYTFQGYHILGPQLQFFRNRGIDGHCFEEFSLTG